MSQRTQDFDQMVREAQDLPGVKEATEVYDRLGPYTRTRATRVNLSKFSTGTNA